MSDVRRFKHDFSKHDQVSIWEDVVLASDYDAAIAKLQAAPPIEPVGLRGALERMVANSVCIIRALRERGGTDEAWFDELIAAEKQAHAALAALLTWRKEQP